MSIGFSSGPDDTQAPRRNKLLSKEYRAVVGAEYVDEQRCSGRSTAIALHAVGQAISCPNRACEVYDHHGTKQADLHLLHLCEAVVAQLGLKFFKFTKADPAFNGRPTITCNRLG